MCAFKNIFWILLFCFINGSAQNFEYTVNSTLRDEIRKNTWEELKQKTPEKAQLILNFSFLGNSLFQRYNAAAKLYGYKPNSLITAHAFLAIIAKEIIHSKNFSNQEVTTEYQKKDKLVRANRKEFSNKEIQFEGDRLILTAMWLFSLKELSKNNPDEVIELAKEILDTYNFSANKASLTKQKEFQKTNPKINSKSNPQPDVYDIRMRTITSYGLSGPYVANRVYVLYKNGDLYVAPHKPLESFNIQKSKTERPAKWDRWVEKNGVTTITYKNRGKTKQTNVKRWFDVRPVPKNYKIDGVFDTVDPFGGGVVVKAKTIYFNKNGQFAWKTVSGGSYAGSSVYKYSKAKGTYTISNHTIVFTYLNGVKEAYFFAIYPDSDKHLIIGSSHFVPNKN